MNVPPGNGYPPGGYPPQGGPQPGYPPQGGPQPGFAPQGAPPGYAPQGAPGPQGGAGYGPPGAPPGYGQGVPGYGPPGAQPGYGPPGAQPGYGPPGAQPGYGPPGGQPGYNPQNAPPGQGAPQGYGPQGAPPGYGAPGQPGYGGQPGQPGYGPQGYPGGPQANQPGQPQAGAGGGFLKTASRFGFGPLRLLGVLGGVIVAIGVGIFAFWAYSHPSIHVVNASTNPAISVFLDDKQVATGVKPALLEHAAASFSTTFSAGTGDHTLVVKDASGKVLDTQKVKIESGGAYLYAPQHSTKVCWTMQTDAYGSARVANPLQPLDPSRSFWKLPSSPDFWFKDTPGSVKVNKKGGGGGTKKTALRQHDCGDSNFEP